MRRPPPFPDRAWLIHLRSVIGGTLDNCQPKPRQSDHDHTEYAGEQCLTELAKLQHDVDDMLAAQTRLPEYDQ